MYKKESYLEAQSRSFSGDGAQSDFFFLYSPHKKGCCINWYVLMFISLDTRLARCSKKLKANWSESYIKAVQGREPWLIVHQLLVRSIWIFQNKHFYHCLKFDRLLWEKGSLDCVNSGIKGCHKHFGCVVSKQQRQWHCGRFVLNIQKCEKNK